MGVYLEAETVETAPPWLWAFESASNLYRPTHNSRLPERWDRVILERDILLIDRRPIVYST
jgi:hypothetical protein